MSALSNLAWAAGLFVALIAVAFGVWFGWAVRDGIAEQEDWDRWHNGCRHQPDYYTSKDKSRKDNQ